MYDRNPLTKTIYNLYIYTLLYKYTYVTLWNFVVFEIAETATARKARKPRRRRGGGRGINGRGGK